MTDNKPIECKHSIFTSDTDPALKMVREKEKNRHASYSHCISIYVYWKGTIKLCMIITEATSAPFVSLPTMHFFNKYEVHLEYACKGPARQDKGTQLPILRLCKWTKANT
jgi:hypothetical protein